MIRLSYESNKKYDSIDITGDIKKIVAEKKISSGLCVVYTPHSTASIVINENYDPNILIDFHNALSGLIAEGKWLHDEVDNNAAAHIKAAMIGPSKTLIIKESSVLLGQWQNILLIDFDGPRKRDVFVKVIDG